MATSKKSNEQKQDTQAQETQQVGDKPHATLPSSTTPSVLKTGVIDVTGAANSAQAVYMVEEALGHIQANQSQGKRIRTLDLNAGHLLLTRAVLSRIGLQIKKYGIVLEAVYSKVPQTQQAALDEGYFVKEAPAKPHLSSIEQLHQHLDQNKSDDDAEAKTEAGETVQKLLNEETVSAESPFQIDENSGLDPIFDISPQANATSLAGAAHQSATLLVKGTLRSGQVLRYPGNLVILGDAHAGSEITADGDIVIWGELRGIAHAGANGNDQAEVRAMKIEALQLRIADHIARRPDRMFYHKPQSNNMPAPEVARVHEGEIRVFKESLGIK